MDQHTEVALIEGAANLLAVLRGEDSPSTKHSPAFQSAFRSLQDAVDSASAQTPAADASGAAFQAPANEGSQAVPADATPSA